MEMDCSGSLIFGLHPASRCFMRERGEPGTRPGFGSIVLQQKSDNIFLHTRNS